MVEYEGVFEWMVVHENLIELCLNLKDCYLFEMYRIIIILCMPNGYKYISIA